MKTAADKESFCAFWPNSVCGQLQISAARVSDTLVLELELEASLVLRSVREAQRLFLVNALVVAVWVRTLGHRRPTCDASRRWHAVVAPWGVQPTLVLGHALRREVPVLVAPTARPVVVRRKGRMVELAAAVAGVAVRARPFGPRLPCVGALGAAEATDKIPCSKMSADVSGLHKTDGTVGGAHEHSTGGWRPLTHLRRVWPPP